MQITNIFPFLLYYGHNLVYNMHIFAYANIGLLEGGVLMKTLLNVLKALSDETRLRIINLLYERELCVCDIMEALKISQTKASRHLLCLKNAGLVEDRKQAQWVYYSIIKGTDTRFIDTLIYDEIRGFEQFKSDLQELGTWLERKNITCT